MEARLRASPEQFSVLIDFMERHGDLSRPQSGLQGRLKCDQLWQQLADILNSLGGGVKKSSYKWKKVWADWKTKTKKKYLSLRLQASRTGGGPSKKINLTALEERVVAVIKVSTVVGQAGVQEQGFQPESAIDHTLDILLEDHNSQNIAMPIHASQLHLKIKQELRDKIEENMLNTNNDEMLVTNSYPQSMSLQSTSPRPSLPTSSPSPSPHPLPSPQPMTSKELCYCQTTNKRFQEDADESFPECSIAKNSKVEEYNAKKEANKMFLLSLVPEMNEMSPSQIRKFKKKVIDTINDILENTTT